jgi:hypothetical protein
MNHGASRALLEARVSQLVRDVALAQDALDRFLPRLRRRVELRLGTAISQRRRDAEQLSQAVVAGEEYEADLWAWLHALQEDVDSLLEESLVLLNGSALREPRGPVEHGLDEGYCELADAVIDELVARTPVGCWSSFTVLGRSEEFSLMTRAISVRYPGASLWDLPVVAHELGHFVGPLLVEEHGQRLEHPLQKLSEELENENAQMWSWLQELFADVFAAFMIGPAYGFTSVMLGFDPLRTNISSNTHPRTGVRVHAIVSALRVLEGANMMWAADEVARIWMGLVEASDTGQPETAGDDLDSWVPRLVELLNTSLPVSRYAGWVEAQRLRYHLTDPGAGSIIPPETGRTLADVLNAAWLARLGAPTSNAVDKIEERARAACERIMGG